MQDVSYSIYWRTARKLEAAARTLYTNMRMPLNIQATNMNASYSLDARTHNAVYLGTVEAMNDGKHIQVD